MSSEGERIAKLETEVANMKCNEEKILGAISKLQYWIMAQLGALVILLVGKVI